jgi:hypothetical protein
VIDSQRLKPGEFLLTSEEANSTHIFLLSMDITVLFDFVVPSLFRKIAPSLKGNSIAPN